MKTPVKRRTGEATASNVSTEQTWGTGDRRPATGESPYQIPTFNTTDWCTGDRRPATGESPYQIPTFNTTDWCTGDRRVAVSDSNVQHNRLVYGRPATGDRRVAVSDEWRTGVSTSNVKTQQISTPAIWRTGDRRLLN